MTESWRNSDPKYLKKTSGGVYFWSGPRWYEKAIDERLYNRLPRYAQDAVLAIENSKTADGNHVTMYFVNNEGIVDYFDEYGIGDFFYEIRRREMYGKADGYNGDWKVGEKVR